MMTFSFSGFVNSRIDIHSMLSSKQRKRRSNQELDEKDSPLEYKDYPFGSPQNARDRAHDMLNARMGGYEQLSVVAVLLLGLDIYIYIYKLKVIFTYCNCIQVCHFRPCGIFSRPIRRGSGPQENICVLICDMSVNVNRFECIGDFDNGVYGVVYETYYCRRDDERMET